MRRSGFYGHLVLHYSWGFGMPPMCWLAYSDMHQFELPRGSPVRVVAESEPIHQTSRQAAQRASRAWPATHQFEKLARRDLPSAENFHLDTKRPTYEKGLV